MRTAPPVTSSHIRVRGEDQLGPLMRRAMSRPLLSAADEVRLAIQIEQGNPTARQRMVESNLRLVFSLARSYRGRGAPFADLVQEGTVGLVRAVERFDHRHGVRFSTYAAWWIRRSLMDAIASSRSIRIPVRAAAELASVRRAEDELRRLGPGRASDAAVAERIGLSGDRVRALRAAGHVTASLDEPVGEDSTLWDLIADEAAADPSERAIAREESTIVRSMLRLLPERHRAVVVRRYGLGGETPQSHEQIGAWLGVGEERSRQLEHEALRRLRAVAAGIAA